MHQNHPANTMPAKPFRFVRISSNRKTGPIPVSSTAAQSCAQSCPMRTDNAGGCYAASGNTAIHWRALSEGKASTALDLEAFARAVRALPVGQIWRHNEAGDLMPDLTGRRVDGFTLAAIIGANKAAKARGFTYTHWPVMGSGEWMACDETDARHNRELIQWANREGFTINASTNNPAHADAVVDAAPGVPVVTLMDPDAWQGKATARTPSGRMIVRCPAEYMPGMDCARCGLCQVSSRKGIVGFTAHGTSKRRVIAIIQAAQVIA